MPSRRSFRSWGCIFPSYKSDTERPTAVKSSHLGRKKRRRRRRRRKRRRQRKESGKKGGEEERDKKRGGKEKKENVREV